MKLSKESEFAAVHIAIVLAIAVVGSLASWDPMPLAIGASLTLLYLPLLAKDTLRALHYLQIRWVARRAHGHGFRGRIVRVFEDESFLLENEGELAFVGAAWSRPAGSDPLELAIDDVVCVEGPSAESPSPVEGLATFRDKPRIRVFAPERDEEVYVVGGNAEVEVYPRPVE